MFGSTQSAISINFDGNSNIDSLNFSYDGTLATQWLVTIIEPITKLPIPIPVPNIDIFKPRLSSQSPAVLKVTQLTPTASDDFPGAASAAVAKMFDTAEVVTGSGQLDVLRYGQVFKARMRAAVRGAGGYFDGQYYVKSVTHNIKRGEYKQSFSLARGGVGSAVSTVSV